MRRMLATTDIAGLKGWLQNSGIEILDSNNPYEVLRYKFGDSIVSVFVNKRGSLTWISPAQQHYHDYRAGQPAPVVRARRLNRGERQYLLNVLLARDGDNCFFCGFRMIERITEADDQMTIEHLVPRSQVGHDRAENCCLAHSACNSFMGDRSLVEKLKLRDDLGEHFVRETHLRDIHFIDVVRFLRTLQPARKAADDQVQSKESVSATAADKDPSRDKWIDDQRIRHRESRTPQSSLEVGAARVSQG